MFLKEYLRNWNQHERYVRASENRIIHTQHFLDHESQSNLKKLTHNLHDEYSNTNFDYKIAKCRYHLDLFCQS